VTAAPGYRYEKLEARSYQSGGLRDKRKPTRYLVHLGSLILGTVESRAVESWVKAGRIRVSMRGYDRYWVATNLDNRPVGYHHYSREAAARALQRHRENPPV
jgi:hypothetical protein